MRKEIFESRVLPDGHLYCPKEFQHKKDIRFKVIAFFEEKEGKASDQEIELSAVNDVSDDFLSEEELNYYFNLKK